MAAFSLAAFVSASAQNFQGAYIGGYAGGVQSDSDAHTFPAFNGAGYFAPTSVQAIANVGNQHLSPSTFSGGGTFGFNLQHHSLVYGGEMDFGSMNLSETRTGSAPYPCCPGTGFTVTQSISTDWLFTGRGRLGVAFGRVLLYGTAGLAATRLNYSAVFTDTFASAQESATINKVRKGWVGGGGVEFALGHHWSVKGEYLGADFFQEQTNSTNLVATFGTPPTLTTVIFPQNPFTHNADLTAKFFRGGINYRF